MGWSAIPALDKKLLPLAIRATKRIMGDLAAVPAAINAVLTCIKFGANFVVSADIARFFKRIPKSAVVPTVAAAVGDDDFMALFEQAIDVELSNMAELREKANAFPIHDIGVAQGNSLSPLLGNILLYEFDQEMNDGDCNCIRYIDDIIILAPTKQAAQARLRKAENLLCKYRMNFGPEKSAKEPVATTARFEFLGIELSNGLIRPSGKAQARLANLVRDAFEQSRKGFRAYQSGKRFKKEHSLSATLRRVDGIVQGWGKHYRFCNDGRVLENLDTKISEMMQSYICTCFAMLATVKDKGQRIILGVELLSEIERKPFEWPKRVGATLSNRMGADISIPAMSPLGLGGASTSETIAFPRGAREPAS
jgi:RNA-directed DNA polymerase